MSDAGADTDVRSGDRPERDWAIHRDHKPTPLGWAAIVVFLAAVVTLWATPYLGRGLSWLLPHPALQVAAGAAIPAAVLGTVLQGMRRPLGERFPWRLQSRIWGLLWMLWLLAPWGGRGAGGGGAGAHGSVHALVLTCYAGWVVLVAVVWPLAGWDRRRRRRAGSAEEARPLPRRYARRAAVLPIALVLVAVPVGLLVGG